MQSDSFVNLLVQVPLIGVFIWFVLEFSKRNNEFLKDQREQDRVVLSQLTSALEELVNKLEQHDKKTDVAVAKMYERTRPRKDKDSDELPNPLLDRSKPNG